MMFIRLFFLLAASMTLHANLWNWPEIEVREVQFPKNFLWGAAVSEYQVSGAEHLPASQWSEWEKEFNEWQDPLYVSGKGIDQWTRYQEDIALMKEMHLNSFRLSVDWSAVEPEEGIFNQEAIEHYRDFCKELIANGIEPMITLHHFVHPIWFEDKGAFEKEENIGYFVRFAEKVFHEFSGDVKLWCTINEPTVFTMMGYMLGEFAPGEKDYALAGEVLKNLLLAHVDVYHALKGLPNGADAQIGLAHSYLKFQPRHGWNLVEAIPCMFFTRNLHDAVMNFFRKGEFSYYVPIIANIQVEVPNARDTLDFFGINYYSRAVVTTQLSLTEPLTSSCFDDEIMTDMPYAIHAEGFYDALIDCQTTIGKPIYVTENGIADAKDDRRELFIRRYLYALSKAIDQGCDIRGYYYWSLIDNFEWKEGWTKQFGLYEFDRESGARVLREGGKAYQEIVAAARSLDASPDTADEESRYDISGSYDEEQDEGEVSEPIETVLEEGALLRVIEEEQKTQPDDVAAKDEEAPSWETQAEDRQPLKTRRVGADMQNVLTNGNRHPHQRAQIGDSVMLHMDAEPEVQE